MATVRNRDKIRFISHSHFYLDSLNFIYPSDLLEGALTWAALASLAAGHLGASVAGDSRCHSRPTSPAAETRSEVNTHLDSGAGNLVDFRLSGVGLG